MSAHDETQRIAAAPSSPPATAPDAATTQIRAPGPLDLAGASADTTGVLPLDELFERTEPHHDEAEVPAAARRPRRERPARLGPSSIERLLDDAASAWDGAVRRGETWMRHGDNALMAVTALAAIVLILVVATFGH